MYEMHERPLSRDEFHQLLSEAPFRETRYMIAEFGAKAYTYFKNRAKAQSGLLVGKHPIYFAALDWDNFLWTVVNANVKAQFSLFKHAKATIKEWAFRYGPVIAVMDKTIEQNVRWTQRLGFTKLSEDKDYIELILRR